MGKSIRPERTLTALKGKTALITGASAGIGSATAQALAAEGCDLVLVARRTDRLAALEDHIVSRHGVTVRTVGMDVRDRAAVEDFAKNPDNRIGDVDILVNNAGLAKGVDLLPQADPADWEAMVETNVLGLLYMTRQVVPHMLQRDEGHVVNLGSVAGRWLYKGGGVYAATKHAVRALSEGLRMDILGSRVRVTNIEPGLVETEFSLVRLEDKARAEKVYADMTPLVAEDIADCIVWSCTRPAHVNIQEMVVFPVEQAAVGQVHRRTEEKRG